jgi:hypothetical protein
MWKQLLKRLCQTAAILTLLIFFYGAVIGPLIRFIKRHAPDHLTRLLEEADEKAWLQ